MRRELLLALVIIICGAALVYVSTRTLNPTDPNQVLIAYVGVFVLAVGILITASLLLVPPHLG